MIDPVKIIDDKTSIALRYQVATGLAIPPIIPVKTNVSVKKNESDEVDSIIVSVKNSATIEADEGLKSKLNAGLAAIAQSNFQVPVTLKLDTQAAGFTLPVDPIISLSGKNIITRRYVSKSSKAGSIKERWSQDDWDITISGALIADDEASLGEQCAALREICEQGKNGVSITCDLLNSYMGIYRMVIEQFDFPFTKGIENQAFSIKGYSDDVYSLLIEL